MSPSTETQLLSMISLSHHEQICLTRLRFERYLVGEDFKAGEKLCHLSHDEISTLLKTLIFSPVD